MFSISPYRAVVNSTLNRSKAAPTMLGGGLDQKALARQHVAEIKEQIEALRRMLLLYGGIGAKSVLQQLKQLSNQLKQAASILRAGATDAGSTLPEGRDAYAAQQAAADAESVTAGGITAAPAGGEDEKALDAAFRALRSLRAMTERLLKQRAPLTDPDR